MPAEPAKSNAQYQFININLYVSDLQGDILDSLCHFMSSYKQCC